MSLQFAIPICIALFFSLVFNIVQWHDLHLVVDRLRKLDDEYSKYRRDSNQ
jgi:hypothetical protein